MKTQQIEVRVRVLGALRPGFLSIEPMPDPSSKGVRIIDGVPNLLPTNSVPSDLRLPNSEFLLVLNGWESVENIRRIPSDQFHATKAEQNAGGNGSQQSVA